jgi:hypothetical protein
MALRIQPQHAHACTVRGCSGRRRNGLPVRYQRILVLATLSLAVLECTAFAQGVNSQDASGTSERQILLIADRPSHGPLQHEHNATVRLLHEWLADVPGISVTTSINGWPNEESLENADAIFLTCSGAERHPAFQEDRAASLAEAAERGAGLMFFHWCVEPPPDQGHQEMLDWIGGYFEIDLSVNPIWEADFQTLPDHPITRGVKPFTIRDEWYYNMRFVEDMRGVTPILAAIPPVETLSREDGPRSGNPDVRAKIGQPHTVLWAYERPGGGRGVGFTGGHYHLNLEDENFRKLLINSILWMAGVEVPANGVDVLGLTEYVDPK